MQSQPALYASKVGAYAPIPHFKYTEKYKYFKNKSLYMNAIPLPSYIRNGDENGEKEKQ